MFEKIKEFIGGAQIAGAAKKTSTQVALEVLMGKWGSGKTRKTRLKKAGYNYNAIQKIVNERLTKKSIDTVAHEVIDGKWGAGDTRKKCLKIAGYNYNTVQKRVNELLKPSSKTYQGKFPSTKLTKTSAEVISDAIKFAKWIVSDNRFGYGRMGGAKYKGTTEYNITHSGGCHFCGTNAGKISRAKKAGLKNPEEWEYTFVCNTFVHACYAHAGIPSMMDVSNHAWWIESYQKSKYWTEIKKPANITDLKAGDVLAWDEHFCLYIGGGKGAEATSDGGNPASSKEAWEKSIRICDFSRHFKQATHVFRCTKAVDTTALIKYGEVSNRVADLQRFLDWYYDGQIGEADGIYGDNTLKWCKAFQEKEIGKGQGDGVVGQKTIDAMKKAKK